MCIILSLTENYYFIKISAHLHYVCKLLEFKVLWECRCCADFRGWRQKFVNRMLFLLYDFSSFHYDSYGISTEYQWYLCDMALWRTSFSGEKSSVYRQMGSVSICTVSARKQTCWYTVRYMVCADMQIFF